MPNAQMLVGCETFFFYSCSKEAGCWITFEKEYAVWQCAPILGPGRVPACCTS